jgi:hypothetical protein
MKNYIMTISKNDNDNLKDYTIFEIDNDTEKILDYGSYYLSNEKYIIDEIKANYKNLQIEK